MQSIRPWSNIICNVPTSPSLLCYLKHCVDQQQVIGGFPSAQILGHLQGLLALLHPLGKAGVWSWAWSGRCRDGFGHLGWQKDWNAEPKCKAESSGTIAKYLLISFLARKEGEHAYVRKEMGSTELQEYLHLFPTITQSNSSTGLQNPGVRDCTQINRIKGASQILQDDKHAQVYSKLQWHFMF